MFVVTVSAAPPVSSLRKRLRAIAVVRGRYLFDDRAAADAFTEDPLGADPIAAEILISAPDARAVRVEHLTAEATFDRPVFLISAPRAGSTLLYEALATSNQLLSLQAESHGVIEGITHLHVASRGFDSHGLTDADADPDTIRLLRAGFLADGRDAYGRMYLELPEERRPSRIRLLEKTPENCLRISFLHAAFPDARFVFLHRHPRPNVSSIVEAWHHGGFVSIPELPGWRRGAWCFLLPRGWRGLADAPLSDVAAYQWRAANERALEDLDALPRGTWTSVEYEELVAAPEATIRRLCAFMDIGVDGRLAGTLARPLPLSSTTIAPPSPIKWRSNPDFRQSSLVALGLLAGRLRNLDAPVSALRPATQPEPRTPTRYACFIGGLQEDDRASAELRVNPTFRLQMGATVPLTILRRARFRDRFLPDHPILWVDDPATGSLLPFWASRDHARALLGLRAGAAPPAALDPLLRSRLAAASVLVTTDRLDAERQRGAHAVAGGREELARNRYTTLRSVLHQAHVAALARYYGALLHSGQWVLGDAQVERRHGWHNEPAARFFNWQLADFVGRIAGERVKPTYAYSSAYQGGAALGAHMDREQCDYTVSLLIEQSAGFATAPWPLWFQAPDGAASVTLGVGDAGLFRGCELPHWREVAPPEEHQITLLFHYVPASFTGVLD